MAAVAVSLRRRSALEQDTNKNIDKKYKQEAKNEINVTVSWRHSLRMERAHCRRPALAPADPHWIIR